MAENTFRHNIALGGAEQVLASLRAIGDAGRAAFDQIKGNIDNSASATGQFSKAVNDVRTGTGPAAAGVNNLGQGIRTLGTVVAPVNAGLGSLLGIMGSLAVGGAIAAAAAGLIAFVKSAADTKLAIENARAALGLTSEEFSNFRRQARLAGVDTDEMTQALVRFGRIAAQQVEEQTAALVELAKLISGAFGGQQSELGKQLRDAEDRMASLVTATTQARNAVVSSEIAIQQARVASQNADVELTRLEEDSGRRRIASALSIRSAKLSLIEAEDRLFQLTAGQEGREDTRDAEQKARDRAKIAAQEARLRVQEEIVKKQREEAEEARKIEQLQLARQAAEQQRVTAQAQRLAALAQEKKVAQELADAEAARAVRATELQALFQAALKVAPQLQAFLEAAGDPAAGQGMEAIARRVAELAQSGGEAGQKVRDLLRSLGAPVPALTSFEALDERLKSLSPGFRSMGIAALDAQGNARRLGDAILDFSNKLADVPGGFERISQASKFFGRSVSVDLVAALSGGASGAQDIARALREAGRETEAQAVETAAGIRKANADLAQSFSDLGQELLRFFGPTVRDIAIWTAEILKFLRELANYIRTDVVAPIVNAWNAVGQFMLDGINLIGQFFGVVSTSGAQSLGFWETWANRIGGLVEFVSGRIRALIALFDRLFNASQQASAASDNATASGGGSGFASGGHVRGPGGPMGDRIPAWLSDGEFVIRSAAVKHYGLAFFAALNAMRSPKFAMGGLVEGLNRSLAASLAMPRFAAGGPVLAPSQPFQGQHWGSLDLNIGGQRLRVMSPRDVAQSLERYVTLSQRDRRAGSSW